MLQWNNVPILGFEGFFLVCHLSRGLIGRVGRLLESKRSGKIVCGMHIVPYCTKSCKKGGGISGTCHGFFCWKDPTDVTARTCHVEEWLEAGALR